MENLIFKRQTVTCVYLRLNLLAAQNLTNKYLCSKKTKNVCKILKNPKEILKLQSTPKVTHNLK